MSLEAISPPQRGSAEGVTLFCVLIGLLSRIVEEENFWNFILIVISSLVRWKFILHTCKRLFFRNEIGRPRMCTPYLILMHLYTHYGVVTVARHRVLSFCRRSWHFLWKFTFGFYTWIYDITLISIRPQFFVTAVLHLRVTFYHSL